MHFYLCNSVCFMLLLVCSDAQPCSNPAWSSTELWYKFKIHYSVFQNYCLGSPYKSTCQILHLTNDLTEMLLPVSDCEPVQLINNVAFETLSFLTYNMIITLMMWTILKLKIPDVWYVRLDEQQQHIFSKSSIVLWSFGHQSLLASHLSYGRWSTLRLLWFMVLSINQGVC